MQSPDQNVERNRQLLLDRSLVGLKKYGVTTERDDLTLNEWLQHLLEELLDAANYVQAAMNNAAPDTFAQRFSMYEGMLLWILYHHQGGKSTIGQPIRRLLGIKQHAPLSAMQVQHAEAVARMYGSPNNLHAEPSATDTTPPTLCQTIHLGQPGVTVEPCLMLGPADDEVACLLFTAPGTEVRLTWPTQTQALAVLAAATGEQALPPAVPLADKHHGMRISAGGVLRRVKGDLKFGAITLLEHLEQMAELFYSGDLTAVDTFLQLYDLDEKRPQQQAPTSAEVQHEP